jgi:hypothetical protein
MAKLFLVLFAAVSITSISASAEWVEVPKAKIPVYVTAVRQNYGGLNCPGDTWKYIYGVMEYADQVQVDTSGAQPSIRIGRNKSETHRELVIVTTTAGYDGILELEQRDEEYKAVAGGSLIDPVLEWQWATVYSSICK